MAYATLRGELMESYWAQRGLVVSIRYWVSVLLALSAESYRAAGWAACIVE